MHPIVRHLLGIDRICGPPSEPPRQGEARRTPLPDSIEGIRFEINTMKQYVHHFSGDPFVVQVARNLVRSCPDKDWVCEQQTVYEWLKAHTRYVLDPRYKEMLVTPARLLRDILSGGVGMEDCDGLATLLATMLSALGHPVKFRFGGTRGVGIHHVWVQAFNGRRWVDMDLAEKLPYGKHRAFQIYEEEKI